MLTRFICSTLLLVYFISLSAQTEISSFKIQLNRESDVSIAQNDTAVFLIFDYDQAYELIELDSNLQEVKRYIFEKKDSLIEMKMVRLLVQQNQLLLYYQASLKDHHLRCVRLSLKDKELKPLPLNVPYDKDWRLLKSFVHKAHFYLFKVHEKNHQLRIYKVGSEGYETYEFKVPIPAFYHRLKEPGQLYIPMINFDYVLPKHNTSSEKLYVTDSLAIFSFEDLDSLQTRLFSIDLRTFETKTQLFPYTDSLKSAAKWNANSLIYNGFIFQTIVPPKRRQLNLRIRHIESGAILREQSFASDEEIIRSFGTIKARKIKERSYKDRYSYKAKLLPKMKGDIGLLLENLDAENMSFSFGFYRNVRFMPHELAILGASLAFNLAFVSGQLPLENDNGLSYNPFVGVFSFGYGIYGISTINHRSYTYAQAVLDRGHMLLRKGELNASRSSKLNNYIHGQKLFRKGFSQLIFKRGESLYYGFYHKQSYKLVVF